MCALGLCVVCEQSMCVRMFLCVYVCNVYVCIVCECVYVCVQSVCVCAKCLLFRAEDVAIAAGLSPMQQMALLMSWDVQQPPPHGPSDSACGASTLLSSSGAHNQSQQSLHAWHLHIPTVFPGSPCSWTACTTGYAAHVACWCDLHDTANPKDKKCF